MGASGERGPDRQVQTPSGKWHANGGREVKRYFFESERVRRLSKSTCAHYEARMKDGIFALIAGELRPSSTRPSRIGASGKTSSTQPARVSGWTSTGSNPTTQTRQSTAGAHIEGDAEGAVFCRTEAIAEGIHARRVHGVCDFGVRPEVRLDRRSQRRQSPIPGNVEDTRALTCKQKEKLAEALKALPGLSGVDDDLDSLAHFEFVPRPVFLPGVADPIRDPVYALPGGLLDVDAVCAELGIDLDAEGDAPIGALRAGEARGQPKRGSPPTCCFPTRWRWPTA